MTRQEVYETIDYMLEEGQIEAVPGEFRLSPSGELGQVYRLTAKGRLLAELRWGLEDGEA